MGTIFISHSSLDNDETFIVRDWLVEQGWGKSQIFLDLENLYTGDRWRHQLNAKGVDCEVVVLCLSDNWLKSPECLREHNFAEASGKHILPIIIKPITERIPSFLTDLQFANIADPASREEGFLKLKSSLLNARIGPTYFRWPPNDDPDRPAYRGLRALEDKDAAVFFGRDAAITKGLDALRQMRDGASERMLVVLGASGAGKSSFLQAGLLARLKRDTENFIVLPVMRPRRAALTGSDGLLASLAVADTNKDLDLAESLMKIRNSAPAFNQLSGKPEDEQSSERPLTIILPIDQAEEFFNSDHDEAGKSLDLLAHLFEADPNFIAVATIRSDSFEKLQHEPRLAEIPRRPFDLSRLPTSAFKEVIEGPGKLLTPPIEFAPELTDRLIEDLQSLDALPLLAFTLEKLVFGFNGSGRITLDEYEKNLNGLTGAISNAVKTVYDTALQNPALPNTRVELEAIARRTFVPWLVSVDNNKAEPKRRIALRSEFPADTNALIQDFVNQRLLISDQPSNGEPTIEISHEAILRNWNDLTVWISEERDALSLAEQVIRSAKEWSDSNEEKSESQRDLMLVHRGERLLTAEKLLHRGDISSLVGPVACDYISACRMKEDADREAENMRREKEEWQLFRQRRLQQWASGAIAVAVCATLFGAWFVVNEKRNLGRAQSLALAQFSSQAFQDGDHLQGARLAILAARDSFFSPSTDESRNMLVSNAQLLSPVIEISGHESSVDDAFFSRYEKDLWTLTSTGNLRRWNSVTGEAIEHSIQRDGETSGTIFSNKKSHALVWNSSGVAQYFNLPSGKQVGQDLVHGGPIRNAIISEDYRRIVTWGHDNSVNVWDASNGLRLSQLNLPQKKDTEKIRELIYSRSADRIFTMGNFGSDRLWDASNGRQIKLNLYERSEFREIGETFAGAAFSNDGSRILTWSRFGTVRIISASSGNQIGPEFGHGGSLKGASFSNDETQILTWDNLGRVVLWDAGSGKAISPIFAHFGEVIGASLSGDENKILSWGYDNSARLWSITEGKSATPPLLHDSYVYGAVFSNDDDRVLTWSADGTARLWDVSSGNQLGSALVHDDSITGAAFSQDENYILTWAADGKARIWDITSGASIVTSLSDGKKTSSVVSVGSHSTLFQDQQHIWVWNESDTVLLWEIESGEQFGSISESETFPRGVTFTKDKTRILVWGIDNSATTLEATTGEQVGPSLLHDRAVLGATFSPDESQILTWSQDKRVRIWDTSTGQLAIPALQHDGDIEGAAFFPDGMRILTWSRDKAARIWDVSGGSQSTLEIAHDDHVLGATIFKDGKRFLTWSNNIARIWNSTTGKQIGPNLVHDGYIKGATFSSDESRILIWNDVGYSNVVQLWRTATGEKVGPNFQRDVNLQTIEGAAFSSDESRILIWGQGGEMRVLNAETGVQIGPVYYHDGGIIHSAFTESETRVATLTTENKLYYYDVSWLMNSQENSEIIQSLCRKKLNGRSEAILFSNDFRQGRLTYGFHQIGKSDVDVAPVLRGREGENVCNWSAPWYDRVLQLTLGWAFP